MVIYAPEDDARLYPDQPKRRVVSWAIRIEWDNGEEEDLIDVPDDVSGPITYGCLKLNKINTNLMVRGYNHGIRHVCLFS